MNETSLIVDSNLKALRENHPGIYQQLPAQLESIHLANRSDGYYFAKCEREQKTYYLSKDDDIPSENASFRKEINQALLNGTELIVILGMGLGYRAVAAFETICHHPCHLMILEESAEMLYAACHCSYLADLFTSKQVYFCMGDHIEEEINQKFVQHEWYGAKKMQFFWGYQTQQITAQPDYQKWINFTNQLYSQKQQEFFQRCSQWFQNKKTGVKSNNKILVVYEALDGLAVNQERYQKIQHQLTNHQEQIELPININQFVPQTLILNQLIGHDIDEIICVDFQPEKWMPADAVRALPILITVI